MADSSKLLLNRRDDGWRRRPVGPRGAKGQSESLPRDTGDAPLWRALRSCVD